MELFYSDDYYYHKGFDTSLENPSRIKYLINNNKKITSVSSESNQNIEIKLLKSIETKFKTSNRYCQVCTYKNNKTSQNCEMCMSEIGDITYISDINGDTTYMCKDTLKTLESLVNCIYNVLDWQIENKKNAFILSRPPGHHTDNTESGIMGFCLMNNVSIGVEYYLNKPENKGKRVLILDWDVHHGNGTQKIYYQRNDVLFIDIHREDIYPYTGDKDDIGEGDGLGYNLNIPLKKGSDDFVYQNVFDSKVITKIQEFKPDWIFISCGFDAHKDDPIGGMKLNDNSYKIFHEKLLKLNIQITYFLEGGYNPDVIYNCVKLLCDI